MGIFTSKKQIVSAFPRAKILQDRGGSTVIGDITTGTGGTAVTSWLESYFEYDSVNKVLILSNPDAGGEISFVNDDGEIVAYSDYGGSPPSFWDGLPTASASILGGIKVGSGLTITSGVLSADADLQTLSFLNPNLSISGGNTVDLSGLTPDLSAYYTKTETNLWRNGTTQTEMGYVHGVTSDIQTQLNARYTKTETDTWRSGVTQTEMSYLDGVTSDIQTQFGNIYTKSQTDAKYAILADENTFADDQIIVGQLALNDSEADSTSKNSIIKSKHYNIAEEDILWMRGIAGSTTNKLYLGGGTSGANAATELRFYTAVNNTTLVGTVAMTINSSQDVIFRYRQAPDTNGLDFNISTGSRYWLMENDGDFHAKGDVIAFSTTV